MTNGVFIRQHRLHFNSFAVPRVTVFGNKGAIKFTISMFLDRSLYLKLYPSVDVQCFRYFTLENMRHY